jgi:hypothetical protein
LYACDRQDDGDDGRQGREHESMVEHGDLDARESQTAVRYSQFAIRNSPFAIRHSLFAKGYRTANRE